MSTSKMDNIDSTASDSFEIDIDQALGAQPEPSVDLDVAATDEVSIDPVVEESADLLPEGSDWFDEDGTPQATSQEAATEEPGTLEDGEVSKEGADSTHAKLSIDVRKKQHEFTLDPNDEVLRRTLRDGVRSKNIRAENAKLKEENITLKESTDKSIEVGAIFSELEALAEEGDYDRMVQAMLGDNYKSYLEGKIGSWKAYEEATPEERLGMDRDRELKLSSYKDRARDKEINELKSRLEGKDLAVQEEKFYGFASTALTSNKLSEAEVGDADVRHNLNKRMWKNSWDAIKQLSKSREITPKLIDAVFKREGKLSRYGIDAASTEVTKQAVVKRQEAAQATAAAVATSKYPAKRTSGKDLSGWNGKSAKDLMKFFK